MTRFEKYYHHIISQDLLYKQDIQNTMQLAQFSYLIISSNFSLALFYGLHLICHQKPKYTLAKKPIAGFYLRKNQLIGAKVTLRKSNLFCFLEKLSLLILPRKNQFIQFQLMGSSSKGLEVNFGVENLLLFSELESHYDYFESIRGINIHINISCSNQINIPLLTGFQLPIKK